MSKFTQEQKNEIITLKLNGTRAKEIMEKCKASGVAVLWLPFDDGKGAKDIGGDYAEIVLGINQPAETAEIIGMSAQAVMTRIGERESA